MTASRRAPGRPRSGDIDRAIVEAAQAILGEAGFGGLTVAGVAARAGTTRPAVYRRYSTVAELATVAIGALSRATAPEPTDDPLTDLVAELTSFRDGISRINGTTLVASMLSDATDPDVRESYRELVVRPRRRRIARALRVARSRGLLTAADADVDVAVTMCTGSWYASALAGTEPPEDWPTRIAALVWSALGGDSSALDVGSSRREPRQ